MGPLIIYVNYKACIDGLKQSMTASGFPWKITFKDQPDVEVVPEIITPPGPKLPTKSIEALIEAGSYHEALEIARDMLHQEPSNQYAAETVGQLENWIKMEEEIEQKLGKNDYNDAIILLEKLFLEISVGEKKDRLILKLNEVKETRTKKIAVLQAKLETTADFQEKLKAYDALIEIAPPNEAEEISREKQRFINRQKFKDIRFKIAALIIFIVAGAAIIFFAFLQPEMAYQDRLKAIKAELESQPKHALVLIEELQRTKDRPELRELRKKALFQVKLLDSQPIIARAFSYAEQKNFAVAFQEFNRVKTQIYKLTALPQSIRDKENELRRKASAYYRGQVRASGDPGENFIHYHKALEYSTNDPALLSEYKEFLDRNNKNILSSLKRKAREAYYADDCKEARYLVGLCLKVNRTDSEVHSLREKIEQKCRGR